MSTDKPKVIRPFTCDRCQMEGFALIILPSCEIPVQREEETLHIDSIDSC